MSKKIVKLRQEYKCVKKAHEKSLEVQRQVELTTGKAHAKALSQATDMMTIALAERDYLRHEASAGVLLSLATLKQVELNILRLAPTTDLEAIR